MTQLERIVRSRDGLSHEEFMELVEEARDEFIFGVDPEEILHEIFAIEPDFLFDLFDLFEAA